ncbi:hypothetical protein JAAARDRAFT_50724 [Jaapia argillacea MUCL 33604]|uniref:Uncharacterized protein n=1 Tax=Jaapia argillacea MUCL 33604 TaxID=933084 RepID=A0A067P976_9AGAM|nr:hypothetical protein JAAARDRAFT_50724 [Jaapia argillacea MUCL 33604]
MNNDLNHDIPLDMEQWQAHFPRAGYWFNVLPQHPFIHGPAVNQPPQPQFLPPPGPPPAYIQPVVAPGQQAPVPMNEVGTIRVSIPRNSGVVGAIVTRSMITVPTDLVFGDFFDRICAQMDLHPSNAQIGYKFHTDRVRDPPHRLSNEDDLREAMEMGMGLIRRARTRTVVMEVHNLVPPAAASSAASASSSKKRKRTQDLFSDDDDEPSTTMSFVKELRQLKQHVECAKHNGKYCYVSPITGDHKNLNIYQLTLWAKKIFLGDATLQEPPSVLEFERLCKKVRRSNSSSNVASLSTPAIHVHLPATYALGDVGGSRRVNTATPSPSPSHIDLTGDSSDDDPVVIYPTVTELLAYLHCKYSKYGCDIPQYQGILSLLGCTTVDQVEKLDFETFTIAADIPVMIAANIVDEAGIWTRRARKGKGKPDLRFIVHDDAENTPSTEK